MFVFSFVFAAGAVRLDGWQQHGCAHERSAQRSGQGDARPAGAWHLHRLAVGQQQAAVRGCGERGRAAYGRDLGVLADGQRLTPDTPVKLPPKSAIYLGEAANTVCLEVE